MPTSEDIVYKLGRLIGDTTVSGDVAVSTSGISPIMARRGGIGAKECPEGFRWSDEEQACLPTSALKGESTSVFGTYGNDNVTVAGSGQTRVAGDKENEIEVLKRQPRPMRFNDLLGIYLPGEEEQDMDAPDEEPVEEGKRGKGPRAMTISGQKGWAKLSRKLGLDKKDGGEGKLEPWNPSAKKTFTEWADLIFPSKEKKREQEIKKKKAKQKLQNAKINLAAFRSMMESD